MLKFFVAVLLLVTYGAPGGSACNWVDIGVGTSPTGNIVEGKPEWLVVIYNKCDCPVDSISLWCPGFKSIEPVDPNIFRELGGYCNVTNGASFAPTASVQFSYAWDTAFALTPRTLNPLGC